MTIKGTTLPVTTLGNDTSANRNDPLYLEPPTREAKVLENPPEDALAENNGSEELPRESASTALIKLGCELFTFGVSTTGDGFALPKDGPKVVTMLRGSKSSLRNLLARAYFKRTGRAAGQQALSDALLVINGMAEEESPTILYMRVANHNGGLWLDLGDSTGRAIHINAADGWTIAVPPILFYRTALSGELPKPNREGDIKEIFKYLNVCADDQPLILAWLIAALHTDISHPVLSFGGEQGSGKTTAQKILTQIIDASPVPVRKPPRDAEQWIVAAQGSWVVGLDNMSSIPPWLSDSICRAVTGEGDIRRKLYTDGEHAVFSFRRCIILNGIDLGAIRGDLAERMVPIELDMITENSRLYEDDIWQEWEQIHPRLLGVILNLAAQVVAVMPSISLTSKPRMADFARILAAVDQALDTQGLQHYLNKQRSLATESLTADVFISAMEALGEFTGSAAELLDNVLSPERLPKGWPQNARAVTIRLKRQGPVMRKAGWAITEDGAKNHSNKTIWTIAPPCEIARIRASHTSLPRTPATEPVDTELTGASDARQARHEYTPSHNGHQEGDL